jgi:hypothetical protein
MDAEVCKRGYSKVNGKCIPNNRETKESQIYQHQVGKTYWFEYHCLESEESCDAKLWHHSHKKAKVLSLEELGYGKTIKKRGEEGQPAVFKVEFADGLKYDVYEDELMTSKKSFFRPSPPKIK